MPYRVRKGKSRYLIQKKTRSGWRTVGRSRTKKNAQGSIRARYAAEGRKRRRR